MLKYDEEYFNNKSLFERIYKRMTECDGYRNVILHDIRKEMRMGYNTFSAFINRYVGEYEYDDKNDIAPIEYLNIVSTIDKARKFYIGGIVCSRIRIHPHAKRRR